jgi:CheY-like chemotaxis protein
VDYLMPEMNGDELCREMKRINPAVPLILLTGMVAADLSDCPDFVVLKGTHPRDVLHRIAELVA